MQRGDSDATQEEWTMLSWEVPFTDRMRRRWHLPVESDHPTPYMGVAGPIRSPFRSSRPRLRVSLPGPSPQSVSSRPSASSSDTTTVTETVTLTRSVSTVGPSGVNTSSTTSTATATATSGSTAETAPPEDLLVTVTRQTLTLNQPTVTQSAPRLVVQLTSSPAKRHRSVDQGAVESPPKKLKLSKGQKRRRRRILLELGNREREAAKRVPEASGGVKPQPMKSPPRPARRVSLERPSRESRVSPDRGRPRDRRQSPRREESTSRRREESRGRRHERVFDRRPSPQRDSRRESRRSPSAGASFFRDPPRQDHPLQPVRVRTPGEPDRKLKLQQLPKTSVSSWTSRNRGELRP